MAKDKLARRRERYTLQAYEHAVESIRRDGREHGAIPMAVPSQAFLESLALECIGEWNPDFWAPDILGFGITWVDPSPTSVTLGIPTRFLPDVARALIPMTTTEELAGPAGDGCAEVWGLPGLRHRTEDSMVILYLPGIPGRVEIPLAVAGLWEKAVLIARASWDDGAIFFCDECPESWHPAERRFTAAWPARYGIGNRHYRDSRLASDVLRRLPAICKPFAAHDMWFNFRGEEGYEIEFEWQNSGAPREVLDLLLHHKDGLRVQIDTHNGARSTNYFYSDDCTHVCLRSESGSCLDLRWLRYERRLGEDSRPTNLDPVGRRRLELERRYGYPSSEKFLQL